MEMPGLIYAHAELYIVVNQNILLQVFKRDAMLQRGLLMLGYDLL